MWGCHQAKCIFRRRQLRDVIEVNYVVAEEVIPMVFSYI